MKQEKELMEAMKQKMISSLEIASVMGKKHKNILQAIRSMEPAWEKIAGLKFQPGSFRDAQNQPRPCYWLTKLESLYISTKFNDEARAKLVMRWFELEKQEQQRIQRQISEYHADADYTRRVLQSKGTLTTTQVAKELGMSAKALNRVLHSQGIIFKQSGEWQPYADYQGRGLIDKETLLEDGTCHCRRRFKWTEKGHRFVNDMISQLRRDLQPTPRYIQLTIQFDEL